MTLPAVKPEIPQPDIGAVLDVLAHHRPIESTVHRRRSVPIPSRSTAGPIWKLDLSSDSRSGPPWSRLRIGTGWRSAFTSEKPRPFPARVTR